MSDEDIDFSDIPEITAEQFATAKPSQAFFAQRGWDYDVSTPLQITQINNDGTQTNITLTPSEPYMKLDPKVLKYFPNAEAVNRALLGLIALIPDEEKIDIPDTQKSVAAD